MQDKLGPLGRVTLKAVDILSELHIEYVLTGAVACALYDYIRVTRDVDILLAVSGSQWERVVQEFTRRGFAFRGEDFHKLGMALLKTPECYGVDLILEEDEEVFRRARKVRFLGKELAIASLEDIIRSKLSFRRGKDITDLQELLAMYADQIDWEYLERKVTDPEERELLEHLRKGEKIVVEVQPPRREFCPKER